MTYAGARPLWRSPERNGNQEPAHSRTAAAQETGDPRSASPAMSITRSRASIDVASSTRMRTCRPQSTGLGGSSRKGANHRRSDRALIYTAPAISPSVFLLSIQERNKDIRLRWRMSLRIRMPDDAHRGHLQRRLPFLVHPHLCIDPRHDGHRFLDPFMVIRP